MKRIELEKYLGKRVEVELFDGDVLSGILRKTQDELFKDNPNLYLPKNFYFLTETEESKNSAGGLFKVSHITRFKVIN